MFSTETADDVVQRAWRNVNDPEKVHVYVRVCWTGSMCLPSLDGDDEESAIFSQFTFADNHAIESATIRYMDVGGGRKVQVLDSNEFRRFMLKKSLLSWSLDVPVERADGWMTPESYGRVSSIPAPLMDAFLDGFEDTMAISDDEAKLIDRQSAILFSETSNGVADACEAVSLFCVLGNFWEKFGLNRDVLPKLPYREYLRLKVMMGKEGDRLKAQGRAKNQPGARVAGRGGRPRPSMGTRIPM